MADLFKLYVIQRMQNRQRFWMLALMPPPPCESRGTLFYAEKIDDRSSQQPGSVPQRTLKDQLLDDENLISRQYITHIWNQDLEGPDSFIESIQMAAGFEEKIFIKEALDNLEMVELVPGGFSRSWSRLNIGSESLPSAAGSPSYESISSGSSQDSKSSGVNQQRHGSSSPPVKRVRSSTPGYQSSGSTPPRSPRHGPPASTDPLTRGQQRMQASRRGLAAGPSPSPESKTRSTARKSRLSQVARSEELIDPGAARAQSPNQAGPSSARPQPSTLDDLFKQFSQSENPTSQRSKTTSPPRMPPNPFHRR